MKLAPPKKIASYRKQGWWGDDTFYDVFLQAAAKRPQALAAIDPPDREALTGRKPRRLVWADLADEVERTAAALSGQGLVKGDRVVMQMPNVVDTLSIYLACAKLGIILSPVPVQYAGHELRHAMDAVRPRAFIASRMFKDRELARGCKAVAGDRAKVLSMDGGGDGLVDFSAEISRANTRKGPFGLGGAVAKQKGEADDCFTICWTSGTTGVPKGVPRSHNHWLAIGPATYHGMAIQPHDVLLNPFPMTNMAAIGGMFVSWLLSEGTLVLHHPFDLPVFLKQLVTEKVTATIAPPAVLTMLLKQEGMLDQFDLSRLRVIGSGSAPLSEFMVAGWQKRGVEIVNLFGSNEGISLCSGPGDVPDPALRATAFPRFGYKGAHFTNPMHTRIETKLVSIETGQEVTQPGEDGELLVRGPSVFEGYWGSTAAEQKEVFDADGYFRTGDLFQISAEDQAFFSFRGRAKDIIIRGGVNISAAELDTLLEGHPKLTEAAVFGMPDEVMGERIWVAAVPKEGGTVTLEEIVEFLKAKEIANFKLPEQLIIVDALPRNPLNKVLRWRLVEIAKEKHA
ncbi:MAG: class I adenylate-forming enzyme family protein [Glycocaulis sp.]